MKKYIRPVLSFLLVMVIGFLFGFMLGFFVNLESLAFDGMHWFTLILVICLAFYIALPIQILVHEGGHLLFGLLTGYRFVSFRLFSLVLTRSNGHLKLKRYALCGTAGQCLMLPPILNHHQHPYLLYNLGGIILNLASSFIMLLCLVVLPVNAYWLLFGLIFCLVGFYFAVVLNRTLYQRKIKKNCKIKKPMDGALCRIQLHNVPSFIWLYRSYGL